MNVENIASQKYRRICLLEIPSIHKAAYTVITHSSLYKPINKVQNKCFIIIVLHSFLK